jgi:hypothetical protein
MTFWNRRITSQKREPKRPRQASLRRAVSTAYYSLFHLLISSAILQWKGVHQRSQMPRGFGHGAMKDASRKTVNRQFDTADAAIAAQLSILRPLLLPAGKLSSMRSLQRTI